jgi:hypothetical protein
MAKMKSLKAFFSILIVAIMLASCYDLERFGDRMRLSKDQFEKAKPILNEYLQRQDKIIEELQALRPKFKSRHKNNAIEGQSGEMVLTPAAWSDQAAPLKEAKQKFEENDNAAVQQLQAFLSPEQIQTFKTYAEDYRKDQLRQARGGGGHGGGHRGGHGGGFGGRGGGGMESGPSNFGGY